MLKVFIEKDISYYNEICYIWDVYCRDQSIAYAELDDISSAEIIIGHSEGSTIFINKELYQSILNGRVDNRLFIENSGNVFLGHGRVDQLSTAFYILSCAQELDRLERDAFNRFMFSSSFQCKLKIEREDKVSRLFDELTDSVEILKNAANKRDKLSSIFLSHDIDVLWGALMQDGYFCLKNMDLSGFLNVIKKNLFHTPSWMNMTRIIEVEKRYGYNSTFFWLPQKGRSYLGISNADYDITEPRIQTLMDIVESSGSVNAIHKSISKEDFSYEIKRMGRDVFANRYHYLVMDPHKDLLKMERAGIKFDSSISFAEKTSFRNGYSKPYMPYIFSERRPARLVECPMHIMDTTYYNYLKMSAESAYEDVISFIDCHSKNAVISILWHNNFVSDYKYKDYCLLYEKILSYLSERGLKSISPLEIIRNFKL